MRISMRWMFPLLSGVLLSIAACGSDSNDNSQEQLGAAPIGSVENMSTAARSTCTPPLTLCNKGKAGCVDLQTDYDNCGSCGHVCEGGNRSMIHCIAGRCSLTCPLSCAKGTYCCFHCGLTRCMGWRCDPTPCP